MVLAFISYAVVLLLYFLLDHFVPFSYGQGFMSFVIEVAFVLPSLLVSVILLDLKDNKMYKLVFNTTTVVMMITLVLVAIVNVITPGILRRAALTLSSNGSEFSTYARLGIPNYSAMHSFPLFLPLLLYRIKHMVSSKWVKLFYICMILLLLNAVSGFAITTMIFYAFIALILGVLINGQLDARSIAILMIFGLASIIMFNESNLILMFDGLESYFDGTEVANKVSDIRNLILNGDASGGTLSVRHNHHKESIMVFCDNPLFGGGEVGGHSIVLDQMARLGLFGFIPYFLMIFWTFKSWYAKLTKDSTWFYLIAWIGIVTQLAVKGLFGSSSWLYMFVIIPSFLLYKPDKNLYTE